MKSLECVGTHVLDFSRRLKDANLVHFSSIMKKVLLFQFIDKKRPTTNGVVKLVWVTAYFMNCENDMMWPT